MRSTVGHRHRPVLRLAVGISAALVLALVAAGCRSDDDDDSDSGSNATTASGVPTTKDPSESDGSCPNKVQVGGGDISSIEVFANTQRADDRQVWCDTFSIARMTEPAIKNLVSSEGCWSKPSTTNLVECPYRGLAAIEIGPDTDFRFYSAGRPQLVYDLTPGGDTNLFECVAFEDQSDGKCDTTFSNIESNATFSFYRYRPDWEMTATSQRWVFTGSAKLSQGNIATGSVNHFSTMVLVELPIPTVIGESAGTTTIASAFESPVDGDRAVGSDIFVAVKMAEEDGLPLAPDGEAERLIQLVGEVTATTLDAVEPCVETDPLAELLTCAFPLGAEVDLTWDGTGIFQLDGPVAAVLEVTGGLAVY